MKCHECDVELGEDDKAGRCAWCWQKQLSKYPLNEAQQHVVEMQTELKERHDKIEALETKRNELFKQLKDQTEERNTAIETITSGYQRDIRDLEQKVAWADKSRNEQTKNIMTLFGMDLKGNFFEDLRELQAELDDARLSLSRVLGKCEWPNDREVCLLHGSNKKCSRMTEGPPAPGKLAFLLNGLIDKSKGGAMIRVADIELVASHMEADLKAKTAQCIADDPELCLFHGPNPTCSWSVHHAQPPVKEPECHFCNDTGMVCQHSWLPLGFCRDGQRTHVSLRDGAYKITNHAACDDAQCPCGRKWDPTKED